MLEKGLIVNSLLEDTPHAIKQAAGKEGGPPVFIVHESKLNLNNLKIALKKFKVSIGV